ncbi:Putative E3 ubiquitin-protein ligase [Rhodosporidiobolus nylandii]
MEAPVLLADYTPDAAQRRALLSSFIGLLSNLPNSLHHRLVLYLTSPSYPRHLLLEKAELVCSFLSWRIGEAANPAPGTAGVDYRTDWRVRAGARVASLLLNASHPSALLPLSSFYVTLVDSLGESAIVQDFVSWENREGAFELCQYPFLMSLGVKMGLLGWDGERQMMERAREAYRSTFSGEQLQSPLLVLRVRREHLVSDSLRQFGMFLHDEESNLCWFNPASFETDDFWLVGVVIGLALYNQATLDVPLPLATYKRLLSEPTTLADLAQLHPSLARGLQQLLDFPDADSVEETFCRSFVGEYEAWGEVVGIELVEGGKEIAVTGENRQEYVRLLTKFYLDTSISTQFDAFAEGFHEVCAGNALSLFKAEELELVVRGSEEPLEVEQLRLATVYEGFAAGDETVEVFWTVFGSLSATRQRSLLYFITASDRIPATGTSALQLKLQCLGPDSDRLPQSHTCFNTLSLYRYSTQEKMERMLMRAMEESEGFGLR